MYILRKYLFFVLTFSFFVNAYGSDSTQTFINRLNEGRNAGIVREHGWEALLSFAGSTHSTQTFTNRLNEGRSAGIVSEHGWEALLSFAGSRH